MASLQHYLGRQPGGGNTLGLGLASYIMTHACIGDGHSAHATLYEQAKGGLCKDLVDMMASIDTLLFKSISGKAGGPRTAAQAVNIAIKTARGDGIHNVSVLLVSAVRSCA